MPIPIESITAVVNYSWADEARDYEDCATNGNWQEGHVFEHLMRIQEWLATNPVEQTKVWVLTLETKFGVDTSLHSSQDGAWDAVVEHVRENWGGSGPDGDAPEDDHEAVATYFEHRDSTDSYTIDEQEVT